MKNFVSYFTSPGKSEEEKMIPYYVNVLLMKKGLLGAGPHKLVDSDIRFQILIIGAIQSISLPDPEEKEPET